MIENILFFVVKNIFFQSRLWNFMIKFINSGQLMVTDVKLLWKRGELITRRVVMLSGLLDRWKKLCYMVILFSLFFVPKNYLLLRMGKFRSEEGGVDYKACSHAIRAIRQMEEIMLYGNLVFPLLCAEELLAIKNGEIPWEEIKFKLEQGLDRIDDLAKEHSSFGKFDHKFVKFFILKTYREQDACGRIM